jgi:hypothetical protein
MVDFSYTKLLKLRIKIYQSNISNFTSHNYGSNQLLDSYGTFIHIRSGAN